MQYLHRVTLSNVLVSAEKARLLTIPIDLLGDKNFLPPAQGAMIARAGRYPTGLSPA
jgi:hypothetical protein